MTCHLIKTYFMFKDASFNLKCLEFGIWCLNMNYKEVSSSNFVFSQFLLSITKPQLILTTSLKVDSVQPNSGNIFLSVVKAF